MAKRWILGLVALLAAVGPVGAQTRTDVHPGKVQIRSTASDALTVLGGVSVAGTMAATTAVTAPTITLTSANPIINLSESDASADNKNARFIVNGELLYLQMSNDAGSVFTTAWQVARSGSTATQFRLGMDGSVSTPAISFVSDTDTGLYLPAAGEIGLTASGTLITRFAQAGSGSGHSMQIPAAAVGTGSNTGAFVLVGNNTSGNGAPGLLDVMAKNGTEYSIWVDGSGQVRVNSGRPTEGTGDTIGTVVGTQTSSLSQKNIIGQMNAYAGDAMSVIRDTPVYAFTYKNGAYGGQTFFGIVTDYSPIFGMDGGKSFNPVTAFGATVLALQNLDDRLRALEARPR